MRASDPGVSRVPPHALQGLGGDQRVGVGRQRAQQGGRREYQDAPDEDTASAEAVAQGPAEKDEPRQGEQVGVHGPLQDGEVVADPRKRYVGDGRAE